MTDLIDRQAAIDALNNADVVLLYHYPEDVLLSVMSFGFAFFLGALWLNGVGV